MPVRYEDDVWFINPLTGRRIKAGSVTYNKLVSRRVKPVVIQEPVVYSVPRIRVKKVPAKKRVTVPRRIPRVVEHRTEGQRRQAAINRSYSARYQSRPSPSLSATLVPLGKVMTGNDGNRWVTMASGRTQRWVRV